MMAKKPATETPAIDPAARYRVELARAVELKPGIWARPGDDVVVTGVRLAEIRADVTAFAPA